MYRTFVISVVVMLVGLNGCSSSKEPPYTTKERGDETWERLVELRTHTDKVTEQVNQNKLDIADLQGRIGVQTDSSIPIYLSNPNAAIAPGQHLTLTIDHSAPIGAQHILATAIPGDSASLPPPDLAVKFGQFQEKTETHLTALDDSQRELARGQADILGQLKEISDKVDGMNTREKAFRRSVNKRLKTLEAPPQPTPAAPAKPAPTTTGASRGVERNQYTSAAPPASGTPHASPNARTFTYPPYMTNSDWYSRQMAEEMADASRNRLYHRPSS